MITPPDKNDPYRSCTVDVDGPRADQLVDEAIRQAAVFLRELPADLYAANVGNAVVTRRSKYRQHLGVQGAAIAWRATVTVRLRPEIVKERRGEKPDPPERHGLHLIPRGD